MLNFYKKAMLGLLITILLSLIVTAVCLHFTFLNEQLLPKQSSQLNWTLQTLTDAKEKGNSTITVHDANHSLDYDVNVIDSIKYPYASLAMVFSDQNNQPTEVNLSHFDTIKLTIKCSAPNVLTLIVFTFDEQLTVPQEDITYRSPSSYLSCDSQWKTVEVDLTRLEFQVWWFEAMKINYSENFYTLDKVAKIQFATTAQTPFNVSSRIHISDIELTGYDWRFCYLLALLLVTIWTLAFILFFKQHSQALVDELKNKILRERPLVAYQQLSIKPHRDKAQDAIMRYFSTEYANPDINLDSVVNATGVSRKKVNEILKEELGFTFTGYLNKLRLTEAARLLSQQDDANIAEIAYSVGYKNVSYFNKLFKEEYNCTPKGYKQIYDQTVSSHTSHND